MCCLSVPLPNINIQKARKQTNMLRISFSHFVLGIVVLLLALKNCDAFSKRGIIKKGVVEAGNGVVLLGRKDMHKAKEIYIDNPIEADETRGILGGRKMMMERRELSNEMKNEESKKTSEGASRISGASSVGNSKHAWKGKLKMQSKLSDRRIHHLLKVNMGGFMALNADYHMAKTHPPRNN